MRKIFNKIFAGYIFIISFLSLLFIIVTINLTKDFYIHNIEKFLLKINKTSELNIRKFITEDQIKALNSYLKFLKNKTDIRFTIIKSNGEVIGDSDEDYKKMENHKSRPEVQDILLNKPYGMSIRYSHTVKADMLYISRSFKIGEDLYILRTSMYLNQIYLLFKSLRIKLIYIIGFMLFFSLLIALLISKSITNPIESLVKVTQKISQGDFDFYIHLKNKDELSILANSINLMSEKIKKLLSHIQIEKEKLEKIVNNINEAMIVIKGTGEIVHYNKSFIQMFNLENISKNMFYWNIIKSPELLEFINDVVTNNNIGTVELKYNQKFLLMSSTVIKESNEYIFLIYDITQIRNLYEIKKDFVINVSHELKTPLTAIKGYIEMLYEEKKDQYIDIIKNHTERLINIVNDLVTLSKLENEKEYLAVEKVQLYHLVLNIKKLFTPKLQEKNLDLIIDISEDLIIFSDYFKLEQVFINLLDNGIRYTDKGYIKVSANQKENKDIYIIVEDTGIGIPKDKLDRIFERFYVVDKSRSKQTGGTGLGLSIVKHIIQLLGGKIEVSSIQNKGTKFTIILPFKEK